MSEKKGFLGSLFGGKKSDCCNMEITEDNNESGSCCSDLQSTVGERQGSCCGGAPVETPKPAAKKSGGCDCGGAC